MGPDVDRAKAGCYVARGDWLQSLDQHDSFEQHSRMPDIAVRRFDGGDRYLRLQREQPNSIRHRERGLAFTPNRDDRGRQSGEPGPKAHRNRRRICSRNHCHGQRPGNSTRATARAAYALTRVGCSGTAHRTSDGDDGGRGTGRDLKKFRYKNYPLHFTINPLSPSFSGLSI